MAKFIEGFKSEEEVKQFIDRHFITTQDKANAMLLVMRVQEGLLDLFMRKLNGEDDEQSK